MPAKLSLICWFIWSLKRYS